LPEEEMEESQTFQEEEKVEEMFQEEETEEGTFQQTDQSLFSNALPQYASCNFMSNQFRGSSLVDCLFYQIIMTIQEEGFSASDVLGVRGFCQRQQGTI
jgi:hypothetical protein